MKTPAQFIVALSLMVGPAAGAEFQKLPTSIPSQDLIIMNGPMELGDEAVFRQFAASTNKATVVLNSQGGSVVAGLEIGRAIRLKGFSTAVAADTLCASACALAWLAGTRRFGGATSHIGFHAAYVLNNGAASESGVANALVGAYLNQLGLSEGAVVFVTSAPPEGIEWLTPEKAGEVGIDLEDVSASALAMASPDVATETASDDPFTTVVDFYTALSKADGETAAALVIPEKRGVGPFNEKSIHAFYGQLSEPLTLRSVAVQSDTSVSVAYHYARPSGEACNGQARVELTRSFGRSLISRIKALKGC